MNVLFKDRSENAYDHGKSYATIHITAHFN